MRCRLFVAAALPLVSTVVHAYDNDTHYLLTYALARSVGYTPEQAYRAASANLSIDAGTNTTTEPVQDYSILEDAFNPRVWFHAFRDVRLTDDDDTADGYIAAQLRVLRTDSGRLRNPGVYMHALMDSYAHHGYWCRFGHVDPAIPPVGHTTDYASYSPSGWPDRNQQMATTSAGALFQFLSQNSRQPLRSISSVAVNSYLGLLVQANPTPSWDSSPDFEAAHSLFNAAFAGREGSIPEPRIYALHGKHKVASPRLSAQPTFALWQNPTFTVDFRPNLAGIPLPPGTLAASYYDGWDAPDQYRPLTKVPVPQNGGPVSFSGVPVGPVRFDFVSPKATASKTVSILTPNSTGKVVIDWDAFVVKAASTGLKVGDAVFSKLRATADIETAYPSGQLAATFVVPYLDGRLKVSFGGLDGDAMACTFGWLGWSGFHAKACTVDLQYVRNGSVVQSGRGGGSFTLRLNADGSAEVRLHASGGGLAVSNDWIAAPGSFLANAF